MVKSVALLRSNHIFLSLLCSTSIVLVVISALSSGAPAVRSLQNDKSHSITTSNELAGIERRVEHEKKSSYQFGNRDNKSLSQPPGLLHTVENVVRGTAKKLYEKYLGNSTDLEGDAGCLLGSALVYLWWIDDTGHIRPQLGYKEEMLCDISNLGLSEYSIEAEELTLIKVIICNI